MRLLLLITFILCCYGDSRAAHNPTKEETVKWLQEKLPVHNAAHKNFTKMCVDYNLHNPKGGEIEDRDFTTKIESLVSWRQDEMDVQNNIYEHGKLMETYTYQIPLNAIINASVTNCVRNKSGNVNAYVERPVFIRVKKNMAKAGLTSFDKSGKAIKGKAKQYHLNESDTDWESIIPVAGSWDHEVALQDSIVEAFNRLADLNH